MQVLHKRSQPGRGAALAMLLALAACASAPEKPPTLHVANPASARCVKLGGTLAVERLPSGDEFGVCSFADNRQCEEWALFRGECPDGGVRVIGYATEAGRFCAISGGRYAVTPDNAAGERGTCTLKSGKDCDAQDFYEGKCRP